MDYRDTRFAVDISTATDSHLRVRYKCPWGGEKSNPATDKIIALGNGELAVLVVCQGRLCNRPSLVLGTQGTAYEIFPNPKIEYKPDGVPAEIAEDFAEALNCHTAGFRYGAAVVARRVLQSAVVKTLHEKKITPKDDLVDQINQLDDETLQLKLRKAAQHVRLIANGAAHGRTISPDDIVEALDFVEQVFHDLYVLPHQLAE